MNIGIDIRSLTTPYRTGVGEYAAELLNTLFVHNKTDQFFLFYNSWEDCAKNVPKWDQDNVHYVVTRYPNKLFNASLVLTHRPYLDQVVKCQTRLPDGQVSNVKCLDVFFSPNLNFTSVSPKTKYILTIHDLSFEFFPECFTAKQRLWHRAVRPREQCRRADIILTPSENTKRDVVDFYHVPEEKVRVVRPGLSTEISDQRSVIRDQIVKKYSLPQKFVLFLGTIEPRKNIVSVIEAYKHCSLFTDHCSLIIAGPRGWNCDDIFRMMETTPGVRYIGYVAPEDKPALYQMAEMFVYPSIYEGFGFPVLEAMAYGTPVITSNRSSLPEVVGDAGYLVNPLNIAEIAEGMRALATDDALRERLILRGRERTKMFNWNKTAKEFLSFL